MSLALKHKKKVLERKSNDEHFENQSVIRKSSSEQVYFDEPFQSSLPAELAKLKQGFALDKKLMASVHGEERDEFKTELIEKYKPLCEYWMNNLQSWKHLDILFWWLMWRADIEEFINVEPIFCKAVQKGLTTPTPEINRDLQTYYCDLVYEFSNKNITEGTAFNAQPLENIIFDLSRGWIVTCAAVKSKLFAAYGKIAMKKGDLKTAVKAFETAINLDQPRGAGVKKLLKECNKQIAEAIEVKDENLDEIPEELKPELEEVPEEVEAPDIVVGEENDK